MGSHEAARALSEGRVLLGGKPYVWETDEMVKWLPPAPEDRAAVEAARAACAFELRP